MPSTSNATQEPIISKAEMKMFVIVYALLKPMCKNLQQVGRVTVCGRCDGKQFILIKMFITISAEFIFAIQREKSENFEGI